MLGGFSEYIWSTSEQTQSIVVSNSGIYSVTAKSEDGTIYQTNFTVYIFLSVKPDIKIISLPCSGKRGKLCLNGNFRSCLWSTNETSSSISIPKRGQYSVTVVDSNGCTGYAEILVGEINTEKINITKTGDSFCSGDTVELTAYSGMIFYEWFDVASGKISDENQNKLRITKSGQYYVKGITADSCVSFSDTILVEIKSSKDILTFEGLPYNGIFSFDSTYFGNFICKNLTIRNNSPQDYILKDAFFRFNKNFSIPPSQFDFDIPAMNSRGLIVCSSPNSLGKLTDTLFIPDVCSQHKIPMKIFGLANTYSGSSSCDFRLKFKTSDLPFKQGIFTGLPYPNPVEGKVFIPYQLYSTQGIKFESKVTLHDILGNIHKVALKEISDVELKNEVTIEAGTYMIDTSDLTTGIYIIKISNNGEIIAYQVIVGK